MYSLSCKCILEPAVLQPFYPTFCSTGSNTALLLVLVTSLHYHSLIHCLPHIHTVYMVIVISYYGFQSFRVLFSVFPCLCLRRSIINPPFFRLLFSIALTALFCDILLVFIVSHHALLTIQWQKTRQLKMRWEPWFVVLFVQNMQHWWTRPRHAHLRYK